MKQNNRVQRGFWTKEITITKLEAVTKELGHFPTQKELNKTGKSGLASAVSKHGGFLEFRELLGYDYLHKPEGYWTDEKIIEELKFIIKSIGHFPTHEELIKVDKSDLSHAIQRHGGFNRFRELMHYDLIQKPDGFWTEEVTIIKLKAIINKINYFPTHKELIKMKEHNLCHAIRKNGGFIKFRELLGHDIVKKSNGFWTDELMIHNLKIIENNIGHFPSQLDLSELDRNDLNGAIRKHGGFNKFRELMGHTISMQDEYLSKLTSYLVRRGRKSEKLIEKIITNYCNIHNIVPPRYNVKLAKGNVIEFVCNTDKVVGVDVTNTVKKSVVSNKWRKKDYYKHLDELWVVVMSDSFKDSDYKKWNQESPDNVKVLSIYEFLEELDYSLDIDTKNKIDKYCSCTFHTKEEFKEKLKQKEINKEMLLNTHKKWKCVVI